MIAQNVIREAIAAEYAKLPADRYPTEDTLVDAISAALGAHNFAVVSLPKDTFPYEVDKYGEVYDLDTSCYYSPLEAGIQAARLLSASFQGERKANA